MSIGACVLLRAARESRLRTNSGAKVPVLVYVCVCVWRAGDQQRKKIKLETNRNELRKKIIASSDGRGSTTVTTAEDATALVAGVGGAAPAAAAAEDVAEATAAAAADQDQPPTQNEAAEEETVENEENGVEVVGEGVEPQTHAVGDNDVGAQVTSVDTTPQEKARQSVLAWLSRTTFKLSPGQKEKSVQKILFFIFLSLS